jgi:Membrane-associating domain
MILSRLVSLILRFGEFVFAAVVLGLDAHFLDIHRKTDAGPLGREIYIIVLSIIALLLSLVWMLPTVSHLLHAPADIIISAGWFAAFGVLVNYLHSTGCGSYFTWGGITGNTICNQWQAAEAFSFLSAIFWLLSALVVSLNY